MTTASPRTARRAPRHRLFLLLLGAVQTSRHASAVVLRNVVLLHLLGPVEGPLENG
jgi:hypothetical protein